MDVRVPQLAEGVESGTVVSILVKEGEAVQKEQTLLELETNKAVATIPSPGEGTISKIHIAEGDEVPVGAVLISLGGEGAVSAAPAEETTAATPPPAPAQPTAPAAPAQPAAPAAPAAPVTPPAAGYQYESKAGFPPPASPSVRKMALELGLDLGRVQGTESGGRVSLADLRNYVQFLQAQAFQPKAQTGQAAPATPAAAPAIDFEKFGPVTRKKMSKLRKTISEQMTQCWTTIPHVTQFDDIRIDAVMKLRKKHVEAYKKKGASLTLTTFVIKAVVETLKKHPIFNSSMDESTNEIVYKEYYNLGIAVDTEQGLIVPVIRDVDKKSLLEISQELASVAQKTRDRKVSMDDLQGACFTISNQGGIGGAHFTPIVNKPEVAILGIGKGGPKAIVDGKKVGIGLTMPIGLSYDHRVIDGGSAARFVVDFAETLNGFTDKDVQLSATKKTSSAKKKSGGKKKR